MKREMLLTVAFLLSGLSAVAGGSKDLPLGGSGWRKVRVTFEARVLTDRCFESNALYRVSENYANLLGYNIVQASTDASVRFLYRRGNFRSRFTSAAWRTYGRELWAEPAADHIRFQYPDGVEVRNVRLEILKERNLALNGDFALGPFNYSGLQSVERVGRVEPGEDGHGQMSAVPSGAVYTEPVPLKPKTDYRITFVWNCPGERAIRVHNHFLAADGRKAADFHWYCNKAQHGQKVPEPEPKWYTSTCEFKTAENVAALYLQIYHGVLKSYSIEEVR